MGKTFTYDNYQNYIRGTELDTLEHVEYLKNRKLIYIPEKEYTEVAVHEDMKGVKIPVDKIAGSYLTNDEGRELISLYELLINGNPFRFRSLDNFFAILQCTSVRQSREWLDSPECAQADGEKDYGLVSALPEAKYFRDIDKYFINEGKNRSVAAMLIRAENYRVAILREYEKEKNI